VKFAFTMAWILIYSNFSKPFYTRTDALDFALVAIESQMGERKKLHLIAFYSRKFWIAEINYEIYDKELQVAIADMFQ